MSAASLGKGSGGTEVPGARGQVNRHLHHSRDGGRSSKQHGLWPFTAAHGHPQPLLFQRTTTLPSRSSLKGWGRRGAREAFCPLRRSAFFPLSFLTWISPLCRPLRGVDAPKSPESRSAPLPLPVPAQLISLSLRSSSQGLCLKNPFWDPSAPVSFRRLGLGGPTRRPRVQQRPALFLVRPGLCGGRPGVRESYGGASPKGTPQPQHPASRGPLRSGQEGKNGRRGHPGAF